MFISLKPLEERKERGQAVIARLRPQLAKLTGVTIFLNPVQDLRIGGRQTNSTYLYALKSDNLDDLKVWAKRLADAMKLQPELVDVDTDQQENGVETMVTIDRDNAARLGITSRDVTNALYNSFGQRQVANVYGELNQYHVVMEVAPQYRQGPLALNDVYVPARGNVSTAATPINTGAAVTPGTVSTTLANPGSRDPASGAPVSTASTRMVPLTAFTGVTEATAATSISHQDAELATTISFNLAEGRTLAEAKAAVLAAQASVAMPTQRARQLPRGSARSADSSRKTRSSRLLILAAIVVIYLVLGVLYESLVHPHDGAVDAAVGRHRCGAGADAVQAWTSRSSR